MNTVRQPHRDCKKLLLIKSLLQYRFATPEPLETRRSVDRCEIAPLCKWSFSGVF